MTYYQRFLSLSLNSISLLAGIGFCMTGCVASSESSEASSKVDPQSGTDVAPEAIERPNALCLSPIYGFVELEDDHKYLSGSAKTLVEETTLYELIDGQYVQHHTRGDEEPDFSHCSLPRGYLTTPGFSYTTHIHCTAEAYNRETFESEEISYQESTPFFRGLNGELVLKIQDGFSASYPIAVAQVPVFRDSIGLPKHLDEPQGKLKNIQCSVGLSRTGADGHTEEIEWCDLLDSNYVYGNQQFTCSWY